MKKLALVLALSLSAVSVTAMAADQPKEPVAVETAKDASQATTDATPKATSTSPSQSPRSTRPKNLDWELRNR
jgi:hypothetical protein